MNAHANLLRLAKKTNCYLDMSINSLGFKFKLLINVTGMVQNCSLAKEENLSFKCFVAVFTIFTAEFYY